jgi:hypothetical protein
MQIVLLAYRLEITCASVESSGKCLRFKADGAFSVLLSMNPQNGEGWKMLFYGKVEPEAYFNTWKKGLAQERQDIG